MNGKDESMGTATCEANTQPLLDNDNGNLLQDENSIKMSKVNGDYDDGPGDKLVPSDGKITITSNKDSSEVKFNLSDSQNGDAKIDMECIKLAFAGMGKEELMKFASDPFWVKVRWVLFLSFWLIWAAMLAGAITIVVMAPKCASPEPLKWWEQGPLYQVYVDSFEDGSESHDGNGNLKGLTSKLDYIKSLGAKGITISSILKSDDQSKGENIESFQDINPTYGSLDDFKDLVDEMKSRDLHLVMSFVLNHCSNKHTWFIQSENREKPYDEYFIWAPSSGTGSDGNIMPPNNWLSVAVDGGSAWKWSEKRGEFYLHQFREDQPDLNFRSQFVKDEIKTMLKFWLDLGVDGFQFEKAQYLLEDASLKNESVGRTLGKVHDEYDFYRHLQTRNLPEMLGLLNEFKETVKSHRGLDGFMTITGNVPYTLTEFYGNGSNSVIDLPRNSSLFLQLEPGFTGEDLRARVEKWLSVVPNGTSPGWQVGDWSVPRVGSALSEDIVDGINMVVMLLPGTPITMYGEELGMASLTGYDTKAWMQWSNESIGFDDSSLVYKCNTCNVKAQEDAQESHLKVYRALADARKSPSIMYGGREIISTANDTVFAFTRIKSGNPGYLVAFNTGDHDITADFTSFENVSEELTVVIRSSNQNNLIDIKSKWPKGGVPISAKGALVLTFVPMKNN